MRKVYPFLLLMIACNLSAFVHAQVNYAFSASSGTFTPLVTGITPTLIATANGTAADEGYASNIPIGFTFRFNGSTDYTTLGVCTNGFLFFGATFNSASTFYTNNLTSGFPASRPIIAPLWDDIDLQLTSNLKYTTSGSAGSRVFTMQWANALWDWNGVSAAISFQVKLFETSNVIQFIYLPQTGAITAPSMGASIGLATSGTGSGSFMSLQNTSTSPTVSTTVETTNILTKPASGQAYIFTPVAAAAVDAALISIALPISCASSTITIGVKNQGLTDIAAGAVTVALKIGGANPQGPLTATNQGIIAPGATGNVAFNPVFANAGTNFDTAYLQALAGDNNRANDTIKGSHVAFINAPYVEDFETAPAGWSTSQVSGTGVWAITPNVDYPDMPGPDSLLLPKSGSAVAYFESFSFAAGTNARLTSSCIRIPANGNTGCGYVMGFYFAHDGEYSDQDSVVVLVNNGTTLAKLGKVIRFDTSLFNYSNSHKSRKDWGYYSFDVSAYSGQIVSFVFDAFSRFGNNMAIDSFFVNARSATPNVALAGSGTNGLQLQPAPAACDVAGWTYYTEPGNAARYLFAIQWDPSSTGANAAAKIAARATIQNDFIYSDTVDVVAKKGTFTMKRYWNVNLNGASLTGPVNLRFFYSQYEKDSVTNAAAAFATSVTGAVEPPTWFKTISRPFAPTAAILTPDGITGANAFLTDVNQAAGAKINGQLYAQFNGINEFSGGTYATGVGPNSPLPVTLADLTGVRNGKNINLSWITKREQNNKGFEIERSTDSRSFSSLGYIPTLAPGGNSTAALQYAFTDIKALTGSNYYRLKQIDNDGKLSYSNIVLIKGLKSTAITMSNIYPNPAQLKINVNIESPSNANVTILLTDLSGKALSQKVAAIVAGDNKVMMDISRIPAGTYMIKMICDDGFESGYKKFTKQ